MPVLHRVTKRDNKENTNEVKLKVFNDDVKLYLNPTEGILASTNTPVWTVSSNPEAPEGLQYKQVSKVRVSLNSYNIFTIVRKNTLREMGTWKIFTDYLLVAGYEFFGGHASRRTLFKLSSTNSHS